jgi:hypothetical protein
MKEWRTRIQAEVQAAARIVDALPLPPEESATLDIFSADRVVTAATDPGYLSDKLITMVEAIITAEREMERNPHRDVRRGHQDEGRRSA